MTEWSLWYSAVARRYAIAIEPPPGMKTRARHLPRSAVADDLGEDYEIRRLAVSALVLSIARE